MTYNKTQIYDMVTTCLLCNIHHFAKNQPSIPLTNFNWGDEDHRLFLAVAIIYSDHVNKPIRLDIPRSDRVAIAKYFKDNNWSYFKSAPKAPNKKELQTCLDVHDILMFTETGINKDLDEHDYSHPDWTFADIWREYYKPKEEKII